MILDFAARTGYTVEDILGESRKQELVAARQLYWKLLRHHGFSIEEIARLSDFNHATVLHGVRVATERLEVGDKIACEAWEKVKDVGFEV